MKTTLKKLLYRMLGGGIFWKAQPGAIYLTFDDGPHPNTPAILQVLARYDVKATFFFVGEEMDARPEIVEQAIRAGHTVGYHSYRHKSLKKRSFAQLREDIARARELSARFDYPIRLYRPPYGDLTLLSVVWLLSRRWKIAMWSMDCRDSFDTLEQVKANVAPEKLADGEIILFHDDYPEVENLLESALSRYRDRGLQCRSL